jgi:drug/metabolite transporter (DMT)-like permease
VSPRQAGLLVLLAAIWGASYLFIKVGLRTLSAGMVVEGRCALAGLLLLGLVLARGEPGRAALAREWRRPWTGLAFGVLAVGLPFILITVGELAVSSSLAAILVAPSPLVVALLARWVDRSERVSRRGAIGLLVGFAGVALAVGGGTVHSVSGIFGALAVVAAAVSYGAAALFAKGAYAGVPPEVTTLVSMVVACLVALPLALATLPTEVPSAASIGSVVALGVVGTAIAFVVYYRLIGEVGAGKAALVTYLAPGVAIVYGALILGEAVRPLAVVGLAMILLGVSMAARARRPRAGPPPGGDGARRAPAPAGASPGA